MRKRILVTIFSIFIFFSLLFILLSLLEEQYRLSLGRPANSFQTQILIPIFSLKNAISISLFGINSHLESIPSPQIIYRTQKQRYSLLSPQCTAEECLTKMTREETIYGTAVIEGYFIPVERKYNQFQNNQCTGFVLTGGSINLRNYFSELLQKKSVLVSENIDGQLIINLNFDNLDPADIKKILASDVTRRLQLRVIKNSRVDMGNSGCFTSMNILSIDDAPLKEFPQCSYNTIYQNTVFGIKLSFPNNVWCLPSSSDNDPHIYNGSACIYESCPGLEIRNHSNDSKFSFDILLNRATKEGRNPVVLSDLISDAIVIKSAAPGPAEGWLYEYGIFFKKNQRQFIIFTNNESIESILKTMKLE